MRKIKHFLFSLLGRERYLSLVSRGFFIAYHRGALQNNPEYFAHYYIRKLIEPGMTILDIGANLGYYTTLFAALTGPKGKVYAVEPIPLYRKLLAKNSHRFAERITILPYALGQENGSVRMGIPGDDPHRHGLTKVLNPGEEASNEQTLEIRNPIELLGDISRLDYIKCDVEGYELEVIPPLLPLIERFRPMIQIEISTEHLAALRAMLEPLGYQAFQVGRDSLMALGEEEHRGDLLFIVR
jgi:FkbM family methyltransferase